MYGHGITRLLFSFRHAGPQERQPVRCSPYYRSRTAALLIAQPLKADKENGVRFMSPFPSIFDDLLHVVKCMKLTLTLTLLHVVKCMKRLRWIRQRSSDSRPLIIHRLYASRLISTKTSLELFIIVRLARSSLRIIFACVKGKNQNCTSRPLVT